MAYRVDISSSALQDSEDMGKEIRQLLYGNRGGQYRVVFECLYDDATGEEVVRVYRLRHVARRRMTADEIRKAEPQ